MRLDVCSARRTNFHQPVQLFTVTWENRVTTANQHDPVFKPRNREQKCQQTAFNAAHLQTLSANVPNGLSERYYELSWMICVFCLRLQISMSTLQQRSDISRDVSRQRWIFFVERLLKDFKGNAQLLIPRFSNFVPRIYVFLFNVFFRILNQLYYIAYIFFLLRKICQRAHDFGLRSARWQARKSAIKHIPSRGLQKPERFNSGTCVLAVKLVYAAEDKTRMYVFCLRV